MARRRGVTGRARPPGKNHKKNGQAFHTRSAYPRPGRPGATSRLRLRARQHAAIAALGERALAGLGPAALMDTTVRALAEVLEVELAQVLELEQAGALLAQRAGIGWDGGESGRTRIPAHEDEHACYVLRAERPVLVADMARDARFAMPARLQRHAVMSAMGAVIRSRPALRATSA